MEKVLTTEQELKILEIEKRTIVSLLENYEFNAAQSYFDTSVNHYKKDDFLTLKKHYEEKQKTLRSILKKIDDKKELEESELSVLKNENPEFASALHHLQQFKKNNDYWDLAHATTKLKEVRKLRMAIDVGTKPLNKIQSNDMKAVAAAFTTRGAVRRLLGQLPEAKQCARKALECSESFYPYSLLGGIYFDEREFEIGLGYFKKAVELGASPKRTEYEIKLVLKDQSLGDEDRKSFINELLKENPIEYAWVQKFNN